MATKIPGAPIEWRLLVKPFQIACCDTARVSAHIEPAAGQPFLALGDAVGGIALVSSELPPALRPEKPCVGELWRGLSLSHPQASLPACTLARLCTAMDAAAVPIALASLPGRTLLLFPADLAGRALAALHQAGIDHITI